MACLNFQNTYFRKHLLMAAFIRFRSTCFSEHLKVDALFIKQPNYFFLGIFLLQKSPQKTHTFILMHSSLLFMPSLFKNFSLLAKHKDFDFFKATLSTLNIICIKFTYIKAHLGLHSSYETTILKKQTISRSLLKNLILKNCLHRLNIRGCGY